MILVSFGVAVFDSSNFLAFGLAFFVLLVGIMLVMMGFLGNQEQLGKKGPTQFSEITREIVKMRCRHCNALNYETSQRCTNCGANL